MARRIWRLAALCLLTLFALPARALMAGAPAAAEPAVSVDPRVELISIVFYLSGGPDYNQPLQYSPYRDRVDRWFSRFTDHPAARYATRLRRDDGIGFDAPMGLAIRVSADPSMKLLVPLEPWPERLDRRWSPHTIRAFLRKLRRFRRDTRFDAFYEANRPLYNEITARLKDAVHRELHLDWFPAFFGSSVRREGTFHIVPGMLLGPCNYGPSARIAGRLQRYTIVGIRDTGGKGPPVFKRDDMSTVVHEFCHSFSNPVVRRWLEKLRPLFSELWSRHEKGFSAQGYGAPDAVAYETMVRACVERYLLDTAGEDAAKRHEEEQLKRGFLWNGDLCRLLGTYEKEHTRYPDLDAFMPRIVTFLRQWISSHPAPTPAPEPRS